MSERIIHRRIEVQRNILKEGEISVVALRLIVPEGVSGFGLASAEPFFAVRFGRSVCSVGQDLQLQPEEELWIRGVDDIDREMVEESVKYGNSPFLGGWAAVLEPAHNGNGLRVKQIRSFCWVKGPKERVPYLPKQPAENHWKELQSGFIVKSGKEVLPVCGIEEHPHPRLGRWSYPKPAGEFSIGADGSVSFSL